MTYVLSFRELGRTDIPTAGGKGANLGELCRLGLPVPPGFVTTIAAYRCFVQANDLQKEIVDLAAGVAAEDPAAYATASTQIRDLFLAGTMPDDLADGIGTAYEELMAQSTAGNGAAVAVRSSATAEDLPEASFAGQQETYLNVRDIETLLEAVKQCWASLWTARAMAYRARQGIEPATVSLAVVVQQMVDAEAAGILFTANPTNGRRDQAVVDAAWGLGEAVVGGLVTPDQWVVEKENGRVLSRRIGDKETMTVPVEQGTAEQPVPAEKRGQPTISNEVVAALVRYGVKIENHYQAPMDVEWAVADGQISILQARPITALPEPVAEPPSEWPVPDPQAMYYRASVVEQLPDPLSPLFATLAAGPVAETLQAVFVEMLGEGVVAADSFQFVTINGYAYVAMRLTSGEMWQITRKFVGVLSDYFRNVKKRWQERVRPRYLQSVRTWRARSPQALTAAELLSGVQELLYRGMEYFTGVQVVIPNAVTSEIVFTEYYKWLVAGKDDPPPQTFLLGFDSLPIQAEKSLYDLAMWSRERPVLAELLAQTPADRLAALVDREDLPAGLGEDEWQDWRSRFQDHLARYGHTIYNLDFLNPVPADDPAPLLETLKFYLQGQGTDPHARQEEIVQRREQAIQETLARLDPLRRAIFRKLLVWAQQNVPLREDALADVGLGWPLLRRLLLELGRRLVEAGAVENADDVFWLEKEELEAMVVALDAGQDRLASLAEVVAQRKMQRRGQKRATPPQLLPKGVRFMGLNVEGLMPAASEEQTGATIKGVAVGGGQVTATARVLHGPEDFGKMQPGDVLVASITTPAWTPLFALASAVVTDIGGPLSHGSIVAREYGIPAVLGTGVATKRIRNGQRVQVDGIAGTVTLVDEAGVATDWVEDSESAERHTVFGTAQKRRLALIVVAAGLAVWWQKRRRREV